MRYIFLVLILASLPCSTPAATNEILLREVLVLRSPGRAARSAIHTDPLEYQIVTGVWHAPKPGDQLEGADGQTQTWQPAAASEKGSLDGGAIRGGYVYWPVASDREQVMVLEAAGHNLVYVNGELRAGDPYSHGYLHLPVLLGRGTNEFLFQCSRGGLTAKLTPARAPVVIDVADLTLPDLVLGEREPLWGGVVLLNATTKQTEVTLHAGGKGARETSASIPPLGMRKAPFQFTPPALKTNSSWSVSLEVRGRGAGAGNRYHAEFKLRVRTPDQTCKRTFLSEIDDSVQYYAVNPAPAASRGTPSALFLSLHGAGVEAIGQADSYSPKKWGHVVCPTNRRPYGFDWEEWGRWDALEVLALAGQRYHTDPARVYLTGHSMGGHGTWNLGVIYPDRFAAIGPSAGWISFSSYVGGTNRPTETNAIQKLLRRSASTGDTLLMATNYLQEGVYILHGDADDNVPVGQAREMSHVLSGFHHDFDFHEQPGAGHWWDASDEPGTDCVDWAPMFDLFSRRIIPSDISLRRVRFTTLNPAVSARCHWVTVLSQEAQLEPSSVDVQCDPGKRRIKGTTMNVAGVQFEFPAITPGLPVRVELDGQSVTNIPWTSRTNGAVTLARQRGVWSVHPGPEPRLKNPGRSGPFRQAFRNHMIFVYGTSGTPEETSWGLSKARFDAETFYYRGNGSVEVMSDQEYLGGSTTAVRKWVGQRPLSRRNVILYGHAECNRAWPLLLSDSPVQVRRGIVRFGGGELKGEDLACLFLQPHPRDPSALVGVVAGSGLPGLRLTGRMPVFLSGAGFPDCLVAGKEMLLKGIAAVRVAGFFGQDWQVDSGEFVWGAE
jgi:dienelactone hydrolase